MRGPQSHGPPPDEVLLDAAASFLAIAWTSLVPSCQTGMVLLCAFWAGLCSLTCWADSACCQRSGCHAATWWQYDSLWLHTEVANHGARHLYAGAGYQTKRIDPWFYGHMQQVRAPTQPSLLLCLQMTHWSAKLQDAVEQHLFLLWLSW